MNVASSYEGRSTCADTIFLCSTIRFYTQDIAILAGAVNFLPHPNPPRTSGEGVRNLQMI
ncbi:MAG: hypothetical protein HC849_33505 [Oscillatoriales cyanobacterium RU_3_3]|nr:hypothetical protein [Oscillatoriales cyanobacterium RU_3_3]